MSKRLMSVLLLSMVICSTGCDTSPNNQAEDESNSGPPKIEVNGPLRLLVLDDESLATVLEREWRAISSHDMVVTNVVSKDVLSQLDAGQKMQATDVVIFPSRMLGELIAKRLLRPTPSELMSEPEYQNGEIFSLIRRRETQWNRQPYSVSFGSPSLVLLRRTDLVPQAPTTWAELDAEAKRLKDSLPGEIMSLAQPFADGWASHLLLVRAAPYAYDSSRVSTLFGFSTMEPRIATAPFVRAAEELADSLQDGRHDLTPATVLKEFLEGKAAMAITWPSAFRSESEVPIDFPVEVTELPGSREWYEDSELRELEGDDILYQY